MDLSVFVALRRRDKMYCSRCQICREVLATAGTTWLSIKGFQAAVWQTNDWLELLGSTETFHTQSTTAWLGWGCGTSIFCQPLNNIEDKTTQLKPPLLLKVGPLELFWRALLGALLHARLRGCWDNKRERCGNTSWIIDSSYRWASIKSYCTENVCPISLIPSNSIKLNIEMTAYLTRTALMQGSSQKPPKRFNYGQLWSKSYISAMNQYQ